MTGKQSLKNTTSKIAILAFLATLVAATTAGATQSRKCSGTKVSCPDNEVESACKFIDSNGKERAGEVVTINNEPYCRGIAAPKPTLQRANFLHKDKLVTKDVIRGKVALKPQVAIVVLRDRETKRIIDITTTDTSGNFIFKNTSKRQGLELGWAFPQDIGPPPDEDEDEGFCYELLPMDPAPPLELIECEDVELDWPPPPPED